MEIPSSATKNELKTNTNIKVTAKVSKIETSLKGKCVSTDSKSLESVLNILENSTATNTQNDLEADILDIGLSKSPSNSLLLPNSDDEDSFLRDNEEANNSLSKLSDISDTPLDNFNDSNDNMDFSETFSKQNDSAPDFRNQKSNGPTKLAENCSTPVIKPENELLDSVKEVPDLVAVSLSDPNDLSGLEDDEEPPAADFSELQSVSKNDKVEEKNIKLKSTFESDNSTDSSKKNNPKEFESLKEKINDVVSEQPLSPEPVIMDTTSVNSSLENNESELKISEVFNINETKLLENEDTLSSPDNDNSNSGSQMDIELASNVKETKPVFSKENFSESGFKIKRTLPAVDSIELKKQESLEIQVSDDENSDIDNEEDIIEIPFKNTKPIIELKEEDETLNIKLLETRTCPQEIDSDDDFDPSSLVAVVHDDPEGATSNDDSQAGNFSKTLEVSNSIEDVSFEKLNGPEDKEIIIKSVLDILIDKVAVKNEICKMNEKTESCLPSDEKSCAECKINKGLKYQVLFHGKTHYLCSDYCFYIFRSKQKLAPPPANLIALPKKDNCSVCLVEMKNGQGYVPLDGDSSKPVCSEACIKKFQLEHGAKQTCAQCKANIEGRMKCLSWETMEFCNEDCLGKYQMFLGSYCACCKNAVQRLSLGKYCVRFGMDIRQFCSGKCLEEFKKGLKVCTFCQKDLTGTTDGFLAPVGHKGQFKDFCSQQCMAQYETVNTASNKTPACKKCSVCKKTGPVKVQVFFDKKDHVLCSDPCVAAFRYANKIVTKICDTCNNFFKSESSPLQFEGASKRFCSKACMNLFVLSHRKIVPCTWCKVKKYNFDMIERVDSNNHVQLFCSLNCLSLFRVSLNATSSRSIQCDHCKNFSPAQYHLTMSDASIRNFCTYTCVIQFQNQFTSVPTLTTITPGVRGTNSVTVNVPVSKPTVSSVSSTPIISSVISLAPTNSVTPKHLQATTVMVGGLKGTLANMQTITTSSKVMNQLPSITSVSSKPLPSIQTTVSTSTASTSTAVHVMREIIVRPTQTKLMKNKMILCKPTMVTKGVSCKPHPCHKCTQTESEPPQLPPIIIPIPFPIFVPVPMHMYSRPVPFPLPFVLPVPVPVFLPTTKSTTEQIAKDIKAIKDKIPDNPFEAELLMMAEMVAAGENNTEDKPFSFISEASKSSCDNAFSPKVDNDFESILPEPILDLETALVIPTFESQLEQNSLEDPDDPMALGSTSTLADESSSDYVPSPKEIRTRDKTTTIKKRRASDSKKRKGKKRRSSQPLEISDEDEDEVEDEEELSNESTKISTIDTTINEVVAFKPVLTIRPPVMGDASPDSNHCLKYMFGLNAWKHWVVQKNNQLEKSARKMKLFKTDLLQLSPDELNYSLCLFVKEVRKPNEEEYAPDSIYYLCLGIQMYLFENSRVDNIFTDAYYEKFTECLNEVVQKQEAIVISREGQYVSRIEEEILWESKQLGAHSPHVLLNTLMYFNTKYFTLKSVDDHMRLNFSQIMKHWRKTLSSVTANDVDIPAGTKISVLRYYPPATKVPTDRRSKKDDMPALEQVENVHNVLRCPVKLYEFYLSKCVKTRSDMFYLYPERSCVPDSPVWYSAQPLGRETISKMLHRIRMVREICNPFGK